tara:strand:+ start:10479 stop:11744 length:1266 start_codon:yes stop_codon:yes gene_type:complete
MIEKLINSNILNVLLCIVVITIPLKSTFNSIFIILLLLYSIFFICVKHKEIVFKPSKEVLILILPYIFILIQGFYSEWNSFSKNMIRSLPIIIFPLIFFYLKPWLKIATRKLVLKTLIFSAIGYSLFLLIFAFYRQIQYKPDFSIINWYFFTYYDFTEVLDVHPSYLGMFLCLSFAVILNTFLSSKKKAFKNILLLSFLGLIIFLSGSRIALVCLILIILNLLFFKMKNLNNNKKITLVLLIIAFPVLILNFVPIVKERMIDMTFGLKNTYQYAKYGDKGKDNNYNGGLTPRFLIWSCAIDVGNRNYFLGSGFGTTQKYLNSCYLSKNLESFAEQNYQTHNQYFSNYARGGFLGLFVLLILYFYSLVFSLKRKQILHLSLLIIIIVASLTENILNRQFGIVFFAFFNSLFFFSSNKITHEI